MESPREVINGCVQLINVAKELNVPLIICEQYPKGLGPTMVDLRKAVGEGFNFISKLDFSCARSEEVMNIIKESGKKQIILAGVETHICITQTAIGLKDLGYEVFVVSNACSSREGIQNAMGLQRIMNHGIDVVTSEMVIFEWLEKAGTPEFKEISRRYVI